VKGEPAPNSDHVGRYCSGTHIREDGTISGTAFRPRPTDDFLSINWLEFLTSKNRDEQIRALREVLGLKLRLGANAKIAVHNVGELIDHVLSQSPDERRLRVLHQPEEQDPSHSGVFGLTSEDDLVADLLAEAIQEAYPAS